MEVSVWPVASLEDVAVQDECVGAGIETGSLVVTDLLLFGLYEGVVVAVGASVSDPDSSGKVVTVVTGWGDWGPETVADSEE